MFAALMDELIEEATAPVLPKPRGIIVFGSKGSWLRAAPAVEGESEFAIPPLAKLPAISLAAAPFPCAAPGVGVVDGDPVRF